MRGAVLGDGHFLDRRRDEIEPAWRFHPAGPSLMGSGVEFCPPARRRFLSPQIWSCFLASSRPALATQPKPPHAPSDRSRGSAAAPSSRATLVAAVSPALSKTS